MAEVKVTRSRSTLAKFREAVEAYRTYDEAVRNRHDEDYRFPEREEILLQDLERKALAWLQQVLKP